MNKLIAYAVILLALMSFLKWVHYEIDLGGYNRHKTEIGDARDKSLKEDKKAVKVIIKWRTETKVITRDKIKKIYIKEDVTGCRNTKLVDMGIEL